MNDQERITKLKEAFADQEFAKKILEMETAEEVQSALKGKGVDLSVEEIKAIHNQLVRQLESGEDLDKDQLKNVAGGFVITTAMAVGAAISAAVQATALGLHLGRVRW